ncbi:hypothetical protein Tco_1446333 [Tanacetum coccineum]
MVSYHYFLCISSSSVLSLVWLLILVIPGSVIRLSFVVSLTFNPSVGLFVHEFSGELNVILYIFWLSRPSHCHGASSGMTSGIFSQLGLFLPEISDRTLVLVLGNVGYSICLSSSFSVPPGIAYSWEASGVVVNMGVPTCKAFPCRFHLFEPLSESDNSLSALEVQGLATCTCLLTPVPEVWLSSPFRVASRAASAAVTPR